MPVSPIKMADAIRVLSMEAVHKAKSGHQGMPMGMADVATVLFSKFLKFDASKPDWADRDRFVLSAGHGSMLLYSLLHLTGYKAVTMKEIENFRQWGSLTPGHPEVQAAIEAAMRTIVASGKAAGTLTSDPALAQRYLQLGCSFVAVGVDVLMFVNAARKLRSQFAGSTVAAPALPAAAY